MADKVADAPSETGVATEDRAALQARIADLEFRLVRNRREVRRLRRELAEAEARATMPLTVGESEGALSVEGLKRLHDRIKSAAA